MDVSFIDDDAKHSAYWMPNHNFEACGVPKIHGRENPRQTLMRHRYFISVVTAPFIRLYMRPRAVSDNRLYSNESAVWLPPPHLFTERLELGGFRG